MRRLATPMISGSIPPFLSMDTKHKIYRDRDHNITHVGCLWCGNKVAIPEEHRTEYIIFPVECGDYDQDCATTGGCIPHKK